MGWNWNSSKSKFKNKPEWYDGIYFDSGIERARYQELKLLESGGLISKLEVHPIYLLLEAFVYKGEAIQDVEYEADFRYIDESGTEIVEDVKGFETPDFTIKKKLLLTRYPNINFTMPNKSEKKKRKPTKRKLKNERE